MPHARAPKRRSTKTKDDEKKPTPASSRTKRTEITDEDGWTHVIDAPSRRGNNKSPVLKTDLLLHGGGGDFVKDGVSYVNRTLDEVKTDFDYWKKQWEECASCEELKKMLVEETELRGRVGNIVVLGLGSLQSARREGRRASATQLAALQTIVAILSEEKLAVVLQDPQFTDLDKELLTSLGYTVVEDPAAFRCITENSLVYAIHCYADIYKRVSEGPRPVVLVGTDVDNFGRFNLSETAESTSKSLEEMVKDCEQLNFPQVRHDFSDTKIYWRKSVTIEQP